MYSNISIVFLLFFLLSCSKDNIYPIHYYKIKDNKIEFTLDTLNITELCPIKNTIILKNNLKEPLIITNSSTSCGCTVFKVTEDIHINVNETYPITFSYSPKPKDKIKSEYFTLHTNSPNLKNIKFNVPIYSEHPVEVQVSQKNIELYKNKHLESSILLTNLKDEPINVTSIISTNENAVIEFSEPFMVKNEYSVNVIYKAHPEPGINGGAIQVFVNNNLCPSAIDTYSITTVDDLQIIPSNLNIYVKSSTEIVERKINLKIHKKVNHPIKLEPIQFDHIKVIPLNISDSKYNVFSYLVTFYLKNPFQSQSMISFTYNETRYDVPISITSF